MNFPQKSMPPRCPLLMKPAGEPPSDLSQRGKASEVPNDKCLNTPENEDRVCGVELSENQYAQFSPTQDGFHAPHGQSDRPSTSKASTMSEKGRRHQEHFVSSGYNTGSGGSGGLENSTSSSVRQLSEGSVFKTDDENEPCDFNRQVSGGSQSLAGLKERNELGINSDIFSSDGSSFCLSSSAEAALHDNDSLSTQTSHSLLTAGEAPLDSCGTESLSDHQEVNSECLELLARCEDPLCDVSLCKEFKRRLQELKNDHLSVDMLSDAQHMLLLLLYEHYNSCDTPACLFYWCGSSRIHECLTDILKVKLMKRRVESFVENVCISTSSATSFLKLDPNFPFENIPLEGKDWSAVCLMGNSNKAVFVTCLNTELPQSYWVIKKVMICEGLYQKQLYSLLKGEKHPHLVQMLWMADLGSDHLLLCTQFEECSLFEHLQAHQLEPLGLKSALCILLQLLSAVRHLHHRRIVYLNWASSSVLIDTHSTRLHVKLTNFSASVLEDQHDVGDLCLVLPVHLFPPELVRKEPVTAQSDTWGSVCLLKEMITGKPVWHQMRHKRSSDLEKIMITNDKPEYPCVYPSLVPVFEAAWKGQSRERPSLEELERIIVTSQQSV